MSQADQDGVLHPGHHSIRLRNVDYSEPGFYFVTICSHKKQCIFGCIRNSSSSLTELGRILSESWESIPTHFSSVSSLEFVVMPNHIHGILQIEREIGRNVTVPQRKENSAAFVRSGSLGAILRSFKSAVTKRARIELSFQEEIWQRNYYERILRPGRELMNARAYIRKNPKEWEWDSENPECTSCRYSL